MDARLQSIQFRLDYTSTSSSLIDDFYIPCLNVATRYDRAVGYFRSTVYYLIGIALSDFALRGGKMRLVCSPHLDESDRLAILSAETERRAVSDSLARDIRNTLAQPEGLPVTELLATLIAFGSLEVRIAYRPESIGIFHLKHGLFEDADGSIVAVVGSDNETFMAWDELGNYEGFAAFLSWADGERERQRVAEQAQYFERLWNGREPGLTVTPLPEVPSEVLKRHVNPDGVQAAIERVRRYIHTVPARSTPARIRPQPHQRTAHDAWWESKRGIINHVTGAGKTVTALTIMRSWFAEGRRSAIVLVPSDLLAIQWSREVDHQLGDLDVRFLRVGGDDSDPGWPRLLRPFTDPANPRGANVVIATMQSACTERFVERVRSGEHLLLVADEVHKIGSREHRKALGIDAGGRLGLSATPERFLDPVGTRAIFEYFGGVLPPAFGIKKAQAAGRLVEYDYEIRVGDLTREELTEYEALTRQIGRVTGSLDGDDGDKALKKLLIARSRVLKQASFKPNLATEVMRVEFQANAGQRWLVYCDDTAQLSAVMKGIAAMGIECQEYTSEMHASKRETIAIFERFGGVLCSIHCLDEGVDIPSVTHALILASSVNPREHLQRRGRILRSSSQKYSARIFDALVAAKEGGEERVFRSELQRARHIALDARNYRAATYEIDSLLVRSKADDGLDFEQD